MTIYELASSNYMGVQEARPVELLKKELQQSVKSRNAFYATEAPVLPKI